MIRPGDQQGETQTNPFICLSLFWHLGNSKSHASDILISPHIQIYKK